MAFERQSQLAQLMRIFSRNAESDTIQVKYRFSVAPFYHAQNACYRCYRIHWRTSRRVAHIPWPRALLFGTARLCPKAAWARLSCLHWRCNGCWINSSRSSHSTAGHDLPPGWAGEVSLPQHAVPDESRWNAQCLGCGIGVADASDRCYRIVTCRCGACRPRPPSVRGRCLRSGIKLRQKQTGRRASGRRISPASPH